MPTISGSPSSAATVRNTFFSLREFIPSTRASSKHRQTRLFSLNAINSSVEISYFERRYDELSVRLLFASLYHASVAPSVTDGVHRRSYPRPAMDGPQIHDTPVHRTPSQQRVRPAFRMVTFRVDVQLPDRRHAILRDFAVSPEATSPARTLLLGD